MTTTKELGDKAEAFAAQYLENRGLKLLEQNVSFRVGELDLVMQDKDYLVFVEVKRRKQDTFGGAITAVTPQKQKRLTRAAHAYLQRHGLMEKTPCRFDLLAVTESHNKLSGQWIKNIMN